MLHMQMTNMRELANNGCYVKCIASQNHTAIIATHNGGKVTTRKESSAQDNLPTRAALLAAMAIVLAVGFAVCMSVSILLS